MKTNVWIGSVAAVLFAANSANAQVTPDAGTVRQEVERQRQSVEPKEAPPQPVAESTTTPSQAPSGATVTVGAFHFSGNTLLDDKRLNAAVEGFLHRPLTFAELQKAVTAVSDEYRKAGWIVRAYLPLQQIENGVVDIAVVEAIYGETRVEGDPPKRIPFERLASVVASQQHQGAPLKAAGLDRALLLINDLPGVNASGHLTAGAKERETDLLLKVRDAPLLSGDILVDNAGSRSTGEVREIATAFLNSPFHIGDQFGATVLHADGVDYVQATGSLPIGYNGWRAGANASYLKYELVAPEFAALDVQGTSTAFGANASYALVRAREKNITLSFAADTAKFENESNDIVTTRYKVSAASVSVGGYGFDDVGGGGVNTGSLTVVYGKADLGDSPNKAADASTTQVDGGFGKLNYALSRQQRVSERVSVYGAVRGQFASGNLDSSEKIYLGGLSGVRAYPASEAGGDEGMIANVEARMRLPANFNVAAFYDWGRVTVNRDNDFAGAATLNSYSLQGAGASVGWASEFGLSIRATWSHRIGSNPGATPSGADQDGSLKKNRIWLQASLSF